MIAETVRSHPRPGSNCNGNLVAAPLSHGSHPNNNTAGRRREDDENLVTAFDWQAGDGSGDKSFRGKSRSYIVRKGEYALMSTTKVDAIQHGASVRRLTPTECERLQGLPDGWTDLGGTPDSRRYAALGDAVTANVSEWIGRRIIAANVERSLLDFAKEKPTRPGTHGGET